MSNHPRNRELHGDEAQTIKAAVSKIETTLSNLAALGLDGVLFQDGPVLVGKGQSYIVASEARYRNLINAIGGLVAEISNTGEVFYINPPLAQLLGCSPSDWSSLDLMARLESSAQPSFAELVEAVFMGGPPLKDCETTVQSVLGSRHTIAWASVPLSDLGKDASRLLLLGLDVTEKYRKDQQLRDAMAQAEAANQAKSQFLANMSHDIRTPMNAVLGMMELLHTTPLSAQQLSYVNSSESAARALLGLINDILDFSKIEAGKVVLDLQPMHTAQLWHELAVVLAANVGAKPVELVFDIDPAMPAVLLADQQRLEQILINLAGNALKFTARGSVRLRVQVLGNTPASVRLGFSVQDTGIGIPPEQLSHIFSPFTQAEASTTRRFGGTGLGLSIASNLVELMGGRLTVESTLGQGSTFAFVLELPLTGEALLPQQPIEVKPSRVLLLSGVEESAGVIGRDLMAEGWDVVHTHSLETGLMLMLQAEQAHHPYAVVLMDAPEVGGRAIPWLQTWHTLAQKVSPVPVVLLLSGAEQLDWDPQPPAVQALACACVQKPALRSTLHEALLASLQPKATHPNSATAPVDSQRLLEGLRLLVVEDNELNRQVAQGLLSHQGAKVELAENGRLGVTAVQAANAEGHPFDLVLMDMQMPVMDGFEATRALRAQPECAELPIIAMTANVTQADREACLNAGMNDHVGKPFDVRALVSTILALTRGSIQPVNRLPEAAPQKAAILDDSPPDDWLERESALARFGGNEQILQRMRFKMGRDLPDMAAEMWGAMDQQDLPSLKRMLHTIKGTAATVGAQRLAWQAATAEKQCAHGEIPSRSDLKMAIDGTLKVLGVMPRQKSSTGVPVPVWTDVQRDILQRMATTLAAYDMETYSLMDALQNTMKDDPEPLAELSRLVYDAVFEEALSQVQRLLQG